MVLEGICTSKQRRVSSVPMFHCSCRISTNTCPLNLVLFGTTTRFTVVWNHQAEILVIMQHLYPRMQQNDHGAPLQDCELNPVHAITVIIKIMPLKHANKVSRLANLYKSAMPSFTSVKYVGSPQLLCAPSVPCFIYNNRISTY